MKHIFLVAAMTAVACSGVTVRDVQVSQHWPW